MRVTQILHILLASFGIGLIMLVYHLVSFKPAPLEPNSFSLAYKNESDFKRSMTNLLFRTKVKMPIPHCNCTKTIIRPSNKKVSPVNENEVTCSKENLLIGQHQVWYDNLID